MNRWTLILVLLSWIGIAFAAEVKIDPESPQQCSGMYSRKAWGGNTDPFILTTFKGWEGHSRDNPVLSFIIFEWSDYNQIGVQTGKNGKGKREWICNQDAVSSGYCEADDIGKFLLKPNATENSYANIDTRAVNLNKKNRPAVNYAIKKTGYYCIFTKPYEPQKMPYTVITEFRNAYGELSGAQISKLPFYGGLAIVYAVIGVYWAFLYVQNRHDILPVQNYITATIIFLVIEMLVTWGYYDHMNHDGNDTGAKVMVVIVAIFNAIRNSFSFFLLLIVCMGYGVVHASLGRKMTYARILAVVHFVFGIIYAIASFSIAPEDAGPIVLLVVLPLAATLTAFYIWTLNALAYTMKDLHQRKQRVKFQMYRKLWWCILGSVVVIFGFFFLNSFTFAGSDNPDFTPNHWQTRWFVLDGWLNIVYLADVAFIAYLWRPTANNRRFAMSEELSQDDEGFEIASVRDSLDDDEEAATKLPPEYDSVGGNSPNGDMKPGYERGSSPLPAPQPQRPQRPSRRSLEGETIFAVGEDDRDRFSDSDGDEDERQGLRGKDD